MQVSNPEAAVRMIELEGEGIGQFSDSPRCFDV